MPAPKKPKSKLKPVISVRLSPACIETLDDLVEMERVSLGKSNRSLCVERSIMGRIGK